ncbi:MAG: chromosomal replication initiator protein DnaA, partial [Desulfuromusa sp.]|nr:chromosomal replication initiator protein DnaA [Desulfuromusa sp.]
MKTLWLNTLEILKSKISEQNISTWIKPIHPLKITGNYLTLEVPNKFIRDWIKDNYKNIIEETLSGVGKTNYIIDLKINENLKSKKIEMPLEKKILKVEKEPLPNINSKYTFETFVSGPSNQFAHAAAMAVSNNPATTYNPLFIYGGVGLGK